MFLRAGEWLESPMLVQVLRFVGFRVEGLGFRDSSIGVLMGWDASIAVAEVTASFFDL